MLPIILILLLRGWAKKNPDRVASLRRKLVGRGRLLSLVLVNLIIATSIKGQENKLEYSIYRNDKKVGEVHVKRSAVHNRIQTKLESSVRVRFIVNFTAIATEESIFENGRMVYSSIYRKLNGKEKVNQKTILTNGQFLVADGGSTKSKNFFPIALNTLGLYFQEPLALDAVYSENYQQFLPVARKGQGAYAVSLPDGSVNTYYYRNGICFQIEIHSPLFNAKILLDDPATKDYPKD